MNVSPPWANRVTDGTDLGGAADDPAVAPDTSLSRIVRKASIWVGKSISSFSATPVCVLWDR